MALKKNDKWIQDAVNPKNKGLLRKKLKAKKDQPIPEKKLEKAAKSSNPKLRQRAQFAINVRKLK